MFPAVVEIARRRMWNSEIFEQPPEMFDVTTAERHHGSQGGIERHPHRFGEPGNHDTLRNALGQDRESREVGVWIRPNSRPSVFGSSVRVIREVPWLYRCVS